MFRKFKFEESQYQDLLSIPLSTRHKFEILGLLVTQEHWRRMPLEERRVFCHLAIRSQGERDVYRDFLLAALKRLEIVPVLAEPAFLESQKLEWENPGKVPGRVLEASFRAGTPLRSEEWLGMDDMERYALYQLSGSDGALFLEALREFLKADAKSAPQGAIRRTAQG